jgi:hypothetical protein
LALSNPVVRDDPVRVRTIKAIGPLAVVVLLVGAVTWYLLVQGSAVGVWLLAGLLFAHGWVHLMFVFPRPTPAAAGAGGPEWPFDLGDSWLIERAGMARGAVRATGEALMWVAVVGLVLAALATLEVLVPAAWWPALVAAGATSSLLLLGLCFSPTLLLGVAVDAALLWLVIASVWSP